MLIYSGNPHSQGAKRLAEALGIKRIKHENSRFTGRRAPVVINWGATRLPNWAERCKIINRQEAVQVVSNKLAFFAAMNDLGITPMWTPDIEEAREMLADGRGAVVCRTVLNGSGGKGIVIAEHPEDVVEAPLYVQYVPKKEEYRVHVFRGQIIDHQKKARKLDVPEDQVNWRVRNHANGFIYARGGYKIPDAVLHVAVSCMDNLSLDFGAVDIVFNERQKRAYVLEVNSAPGLEGQTVENYATAFREMDGDE